MIPSSALDRLIDLGKQAGSLRISDLGRVLPVETMTVDDIVEVVARLEAAGISVVIDAELEGAHHRKTAPNRAVPEQTMPSGAKSTDRARLEALASSIKAKRLETAAPRHKHIEQSRTVFVIAAAVILLVLVLIAWGFSGT